MPLSQLILFNFLLSAPVTVFIHMRFHFYNNLKMARTKNGVRRGPVGPLGKTPRASPHKKTRPPCLARTIFGRNSERVLKSESGISASREAFLFAVCHLADCCLRFCRLHCGPAFSSSSDKGLTLHGKIESSEVIRRCKSTGAPCQTNYFLQI